MEEPKVAEGKLGRDEWARIVRTVIAEHPGWVSTTVEAVQDGVAEAIRNQQERVAVLSLGLVEAVGNPLRYKKRNHQRVIDAIQASQFHPTKWSQAAIEREIAYMEKGETK